MKQAEYNDGDRYRIQDKNSPVQYDAQFSVVTVVTRYGIQKDRSWVIQDETNLHVVFCRELNEVDVLHALKSEQ